MKFLTNSDVEIVSLVGTVTYVIYIPELGSKSIYSNFLTHSSNLIVSPDYSTK